MNGRYSFEVLDEWLRDHLPGYDNCGVVGGITVVLDRAQKSLFYRARAAGSFNAYIADRLALFFGVMPWDIWTTFHDDAELELCACGDITNKDGKRCSKCAAAAARRRRAERLGLPYQPRIFKSQDRIAS